ncbi:uncharacterized protein LOC113461308 isoform X4 [Phoenix dactylifera]|uniref:Uncharacterized protein LOC113461308 isoform X4 n=1 Tax=Phoenix dactylifera TaxID=42345 RepID=A0A8B8ZPE4_PHODC|nr:uncharacterized protein LOC113461308 isoform X4 [Phoenix dactylifera]
MAYILSCITKHSPEYKVLMLGRVLGGIATSLLFSAFESWLVAEHFKDWTGLTFQEIMEEVEKIKTTLPHQIGNSIYGPYGPQLVAGGKLQQIWQAHMAQYRPRLGIPAWQTMRLQDPSLLPCAQPPSTFPQPSREMQVGSYQLRWIGNLPLLDTYRKKVLYS